MTKPNDIPDGLIDSMCVTWRHDFWLPKDDFGGGMTDDERDGLRLSMRQLFQHHFVPAIMAAKEEEREECARQVETGQGWITDYLIGGKSFSPLIAAAIRNRKLANNTNKD